MKKVLLFGILITSSLSAVPILQMNRTFQALMEVIPYLQNQKLFEDKKNENEIKKHLTNLKEAFKLAGHDELIKHDLFAPSYELLSGTLDDTVEAFAEGKKDFASWSLKEGLSVCLDCHTRLPESYASSFQAGELAIDKNKLHTPYNLGIAQLIVRRYDDALKSFNRSIEEKLQKNEKDSLMLPFQQILLIEAKVKRSPKSMISLIDRYLAHEKLPPETKDVLSNWKKRLQEWQDEKVLRKGVKSETELKAFIRKYLVPMKAQAFHDTNKIDLLFTSGLLNQYYFENQDSPSKAKLNYWMGWIEKRLKRDQFLSSGELFLKQCIKKYPKDTIARDCLEEYRESVMFDFSRSAGTFIPPEIQEELKRLESLVK